MQTRHGSAAAAGETTEDDAGALRDDERAPVYPNIVTAIFAALGEAPPKQGSSSRGSWATSER